MFASAVNRAGRRQPPSPPARQRGALGKPLLALAALAILAASATAITYLVVSRDAGGGGALQAANSEPSLPPAPAAPIFYTLEPFTVTASNERSERLMHVGVSFKLPNEASRLRLDEYLPVVRSRILLLLSEQDPADVQTRSGKAELIEAIRTAANESLLPDRGERVDDVLFTDFVVQ